LFNVWDRIEENVFASDVTNALAKVFPRDPPRFLARTPHGYHDTALIRSELETGGFSSIVIETRAEQSRASRRAILLLPTVKESAATYPKRHTGKNSSKREAPEICFLRDRGSGW
jgi:hypothetical protein